MHVVGAVASPGVYQLPLGARVEDAIGLAGGLTDSADPSSLNLASRLVDGQQVAVKPKASDAAAAADPRVGGRLNLNAASAADLDGLPGIGPVLAQRIVDRRQRLGPFESIEQLRDEKILTNAVYERIKDLVAVN